MNVQFDTIIFHSPFGATTHNHMMRHDNNADKLLIILPGRGYTTEHPLLYFLRTAALQLGYDTLSIEYGFQAGRSDFEATQGSLLMDDVMGAVNQLNLGNYQRIVVAGKSLGTPLASELARTLQHKDIRLLLLTPIGGAVQGLDDVHTLVIAGDADPMYSKEEVAGFEHHPTVKWRVFERLNHSLEVPEDWHGSLSVLPEIIGVCANFLAR